MYSTLLHEIDDFILYSNCMINVIVQLNLNFVLELSIFLKELLVIDLSKVLVVFSEQMHLTDVCP